jgi:hypothetical protein
MSTDRGSRSCRTAAGATVLPKGGMPMELGEWEEFGLYVQRMREEERARFRD